jgi:4-diphosphocytidyl-2-C-methyl-D-erythritol kinase
LSITLTAPAKINLALHVVGRRDDGYHLIDTLVTFAGFGDTVSAAPADGLALTIEGPFAAGLSDGPDNLVMKAALALRAVAAARGQGTPGAALKLVKRLPVASGIGGGSADAAAALVALDRLWGLGLSPAALAAVGLPLGADVPMCLHGRPLRARGIGEVLETAGPLPPHRLVLVNPGKAVSTPAVFGGLTARENPPLPASPPLATAADLAGYLAETRNDLEPPARALVPAIGDVLDRLRRDPACLFARMSGSGATCFGLYADAGAAAEAAARIGAERPDWWVAADA